MKKNKNTQTTETEFSGGSKQPSPKFMPAQLRASSRTRGKETHTEHIQDRGRGFSSTAHGPRGTVPSRQRAGWRSRGDERRPGGGDGGSELGWG